MTFVQDSLSDDIQLPSGSVQLPSGSVQLPSGSLVIDILTLGRIAIVVKVNGMQYKDCLSQYF